MEFFFRVKTVAEVLDIISSFPPLPEEEVDLSEALGRFAAGNILSPEDLPPFSRSTMDGYAVRAEETFGAREGEPTVLKVVGEIPMGQAPDFSLGPGEAARIATGGMLPQGANAVVMVEHTETIGDLVEILRPVAPGENVLRKGEDISQEDIIIKGGTRFTPALLGLLAGVGIGRVQVRRRPRVAIISTGDELVPSQERPAPGQIRDINTISLSAAIMEAGGLTLPMGIVPDDEEALFKAVSLALEEAEVVLISGGSSVGTRDYTLKVIERLPGSELLCHGLAVRPGKPTILARVGHKAVFGLPGQVTSALLVFYILVRPLVCHLQGAQGKELFLPRTWARVSRNLASAMGREDYIRAHLSFNEDGLWAEPIFGRSGLLSPLARAQGLIRIPQNSEGVYQGEMVEIFLLP